MSAEMLAGTGILRGVVAGVLLVVFIALWLWAYSGRRRPAFEAAARLPLEDDTYDSLAPCRSESIQRDDLSGRSDVSRGETS